MNTHGLLLGTLLILGSWTLAQAQNTPAAQPGAKPAGASSAAPQQPAAQSPGAQAPAAQSPSAPAQAALPTHAQAGKAGARLRNLADEKGQLLAELPAGTVLKLASERAGWLSVEVPGGFAVWVAGQYLKETETAGTYSISGERVNLRPLPNSDNANNFPVAVAPNGARVQLLERAAPERALKEDWARIWAPAGTLAWVRKAEVEALPAGAEGAQLWSEALAKGTHLPAPSWARPSKPIAPPPGVKLSESAAPAANASPNAAPAAPAADGAANAPSAKPGLAPSDAEIALAKAQALLAQEKVKEQPDLSALRAAFEAAIALDGSGGKPGTVTASARRELDTSVTVLESIAKLRADAAAADAQRAKDIAAKNEQVRLDAQSKDPLAQLYDAHGKLERRGEPGGALHYWIVLGKQDVCELTCTSGRYALDLFAGSFVGLKGSRAIGAFGQTSLDVTRIEVLRP